MAQCWQVLKRFLKRRRLSPKLIWLETLTLIPIAILAHGVGGIKRKARRKKTIAGAVGLEDTANTSTRAEAREAEVADIGGGNQSAILWSNNVTPLVVRNYYV